MFVSAEKESNNKKHGTQNSSTSERKSQLFAEWHQLKFLKTRRAHFKVLSTPSQGQIFSEAPFPWRQLNKSLIFKSTQYPAVSIAKILPQFFNRARHHATGFVISKACPKWLHTWCHCFIGSLSEDQATSISFFLHLSWALMWSE